MELGIMIFPADNAIRPDLAAAAVEERGFKAIAFPEHTHIPTSRRSPFPAGGDLPDYYARTHDPFVALTAAAMVTSHLKLWTGICLMAQRDPILTAKVIASLDDLSGGRFYLGFGYGWNREEAEDHGIDFSKRRAIVRERVLAMRELWTKDVAAFEGEHVNFESTWSWPKPQQPGGPPVHLGSSPGPKSFDHIAEFCDGWMPIAGTDKLSKSLPELEKALKKRGRELSDIELTIFGSPGEESRLKRYEDLGVQRVFLPVGPDDRGTVLRALDEYAKLV